MNENLQAAILGLIQGVTEFLPVSSSGHLEIAKFVLGDQSLPEESTLMTIVLHFATALATVIVFRKEVWKILRGIFQPRYSSELDFSLKILVSMVPVVIVGLLLEDQIEQLFHQQLLLVGTMLIITAILLFLADRVRDTGRHIGFFDALVIGIAQAIAVLPGISRSGATISTSVLLGIDREEAARFSFLMVVPVIFGYMAKKAISADFGDFDGVLPLTIGFLTAFLSGIAACYWMIRLVKRARLTWFSIYCLAVGLFAICYALKG